MARSLRTWLAKLKKSKKGQPLWQMSEQTNGGASELSTKMADLNLTLPTVDHEAPQAEAEAQVIAYTFGVEKEDVDFTFELASCHKHWPGPPYDKDRTFAPGTFDQPRKAKPKTKSRPKRETSSPDGSRTTCRPKNSPSDKAVSTSSRPKQIVRPIQYYGAAPPREPPAHFLNLPGEIRNQIYRILCIRDDPIVAAFRSTFSVKRLSNGSRRRTEATRRFPREPVLTLACRQVQREVLSIFYGENQFVFRESTHPEIVIMTNPAAVSSWKPRYDFSNALRHIEIQFDVRTWFGVGKKSSAITYTFRKMADSRLSAASDLEALTDSCTCLEQQTLRKLVSTLDEGSEDLLEEARKFVTSRRDRMKTDERTAMDSTGLLFRPLDTKCIDCGRRSLREISSGF